MLMFLCTPGVSTTHWTSILIISLLRSINSELFFKLPVEFIALIGFDGM